MFRFLMLLCTLYRYRHKETFLDYIHSWLDAAQYAAITTAYAMMEEAFRDIKRESGAAYMTHLHAVAVIVTIHCDRRSDTDIITALFHDATEQFRAEWSKAKIQGRGSVLGFSGAEIATRVETLTKPLVSPEFPSPEARDTHYHRSFQHAEASVVVVKLADRIHNILTLFFCPKDKQRRKIAETIQHYQPCAREHRMLDTELWWSVWFARIMITFPRFSRRA